MKNNARNIAKMAGVDVAMIERYNPNYYKQQGKNDQIFVKKALSRKFSIPEY